MEEYFNKVLVKGEDDNLGRFADCFIGESDYISFDNVIVEPVSDIDEPVLIAEDSYRKDLALRGILDAFDSQKMKTAMDSVFDFYEFKKSFNREDGSFDLIGWRKKYWGCRGDITDISLADYDMYEFCTPECSCENFLVNASKMFNLEFRLIVTSDDSDVHRFFRCKGGNVLTDCDIKSSFHSECLWMAYTPLEIAEEMTVRYNNMEQAEYYNEGIKLLTKAYKYIDKRTFKVKSKYTKVKFKGKYLKFNVEDIKFKVSYNK